MSFYKKCLILLVINIFSVVSSVGVSVAASDPADERTQLSPSLNPAAAVSEAPLNSVDIKPALDSFYPLSLLSSFAEDPEISDHCRELLHIFGQKYFAFVNCLVPAARPVKVCQNCFSSYGSLTNIYKNISEDVRAQHGSPNVSCRDKLLRSDRLMLIYVLYINSKEVWSISKCEKCIAKDFQSLNNDTLYFIAMLNQTLTCFEKYKQGNHSEICKNCNSSYKSLNELYSRMEKNQSLCIDIEDAMNMTRIMWSTMYNCSVPREETVPIIAVSSFMLFLPIIFYLSSFLHSEQKKRKLIHPKRAKSYSSLMNIQDKLN